MKTKRIEELWHTVAWYEISKNGQIPPKNRFQ